LKNYFTIYDGKKLAGFGSLIQAQLVLRAYCKIKKLNYRFPGFTKVHHWQLESKSPELFSSTLNKFYNLPLEELDSNSVYISHLYLIKFWLEFNINRVIKINNEIYTNNFRVKNRVSIHYRVRLKTDTESESAFKKDNFRYCSQEYYEASIKYCRRILGEKIKIDLFCIHQDSFTDYLKKKYSVNIILDCPIVPTFINFIESKAFITSSSSLSWAAHLYGLNELVIAKPFWHPWKQNSILINNNGKVLKNGLSIPMIKRKITSLSSFYFRKYSKDYHF
tara:strand:- start:119 stop:952 length:834 start_codon:yes stop_codon:yes gene_type:complete